MKSFNHKEIEQKWQKYWEENEINQTPDKVEGKENYYVLVEFPYPSGNLHVGHWHAFAVTDIFARYKRMLGYNVLYPIGFDAFGLPAENAAIKHGLNPRKWTESNIEHMSGQLRSMGAMFDWLRKVETIDPKYYRWTQWMFVQFMKAGLAEQKNVPANWCPSCKTVLANEQVINGKCERCDSEVEKKDLKQWTLKITKYADRLIDDLDELDWPEEIKKSQKEWIGRSEGAEIDFPVKGRGEKIKVFTTRPDTIFGATYMVLAPEHELVKKWLSEGVIENKEEVENYIKEAQKKSEIERTNVDKEKTGVELKGIKAINPAREKAGMGDSEIPVFIAGYVLAHYGTGAIMAVPAHDERDYEFAKKYNLPIVDTIVEQVTPRKKDDVPRNVGKAIIENNNKILIQKVISKDGSIKYTFPGGGIDGGETRIEGTLREVREETGYKNFENIETIGTVEVSYYNPIRKLQRRAVATGVYIKLANDEQGTPEFTEFEKQSVFEHIWVDKNKAEKLLSQAGEQTAALVLFRKWLSGNIVYSGKGYLINSGPFDGMDSEKAKKEIVNWLDAKMTKTYRLRDWVVSRQRYWGVPIPVVHCEKCGAVSEKEENLPVLLPEIEDYMPSDDGKSPLAKVPEFVNTTCPVCGAPAKRETDTLDTFVDSSWYFLRYIDPKNEKEFSSMEKQKIWMPVDFYSGGAEHTTMHLLYSRFWQKALFDLGLVKDKEPYKKRLNRGLIMGPDGQKMSKSKGNVIDPDEVVANVGSDSVRMYLAFMGPYNEPGHYPWNPDGVVAIRRFLERVYGLTDKLTDESSEKIKKLLHKTIKKVREDSEKLKFNTAISAMMVFVRQAEKEGVGREDFKEFIRLLAPYAPHLSEELWHKLEGEGSVHTQNYPEFDESLVKDDTTKIAVQVNGKVRAEIEIPAEASEEEVKELALSNEQIKKHTEGKEIVKFIYVPGKIVNVVVK